MNNQYNCLPTEWKELIVNGQTLVDETKKRMKTQPKPVDLICRLQLRDDCKAVERFIKILGKRKTSQQDAKNLELAILRLETSSRGILK